MRTTLEIDDDVLEAARQLARDRDSSIGAVVSALARAGLRPHSVEIVEGIPTIRATKDSPVITADMVHRALEDE